MENTTGGAAEPQVSDIERQADDNRIELQTPSDGAPDESEGHTDSQQGIVEAFKKPQSINPETLRRHRADFLAQLGCAEEDLETFDFSKDAADLLSNLDSDIKFTSKIEPIAQKINRWSRGKLIFRAERQQYSNQLYTAVLQLREGPVAERFSYDVEEAGRAIVLALSVCRD